MEGDEKNLCLSPEHNTSRAIKHINECIDYDNTIKEFYNALGNSEDVGYFRISEDDDVASSNIFTLLSSSPFPPIIKTHYQFSEEIASCGCLPEIQRFYYIIDNKLFLWRTNSKCNDKYVEQIMEEEKVIIAVSTIEKGCDRYFIKSVSSLLAVATPTYIKVYPLDNDELNPDVFYTFKTDFTPTCLCPGNWGQLFIGAADSQLYSLQFRIQSGWFGKQDSENYTISKLTAYDITNLITSFISLSASPIIKICYDQVTHYLATIDITQTIRIYSYEKDKLTMQYTYNAPKGQKFVTISPVCLSDSANLRFIAFTQDGQRLYFGQYQSRFLKLQKIGLRCERQPPPELKNEIVIDAFQQCGYTAFICKESIVGLQVIHANKDSCYELAGKAKLNGYGICIAGMFHPFSWVETNSFHAPIVNQHFMDPIEFFILTSSGGSSVRFRPPCYLLHKQFINDKYQYTEACNELMDRYSSNDESCAMCLLLALMYPEESENLLYISGEFNRLQTLHLKIPIEENEEEDQPLPPDDDDNYLSPDRLTPLTHSFYIRVQRLIAFLWESRVFDVSEDNILKISPQFNCLSPDFMKRLNDIIELSKKYILKSEKNSSSFDEHRQVLFQIEREQLESLQVFLEELIETLKFIRILKKQKAALLTMGMLNVSSKSVIRLENDPFGPTFETSTYIISALREYAVSLITTFKEAIDTQSKDTLLKYSKDEDGPYSFSEMPNEEKRISQLDLSSMSSMSDFQISSQKASADPWLKMETNLHLLTAEICHECPSFLNSPEALIVRAELDLQAASKEPDLEEKKRLAHSACKTFLSQIGYDFDLPRICCTFISLGFDVYAVKIASSKAHFIDDAQLGYYWYVNGCDKEEFHSKSKFEQVSLIYESVFDAGFTDEGLNAILETGDELFILLVYQHLLHTNEIDRLLKLDNKLVLDFLKENAPRLVWKYYVAHKQIKEAVLDLIRYASDAEAASSGMDSDKISFDQRIRCLQTASNYARKENLDDLAHEAQIRIECAKIQKEMSPEIVGEPLKDLTTLFKEAERKFLWSYLLKLTSLMKIDDFFKRDIDMKTLWTNFLLCGDGSNVYVNENPSEADMNRKLKALFTDIGVDKDALNPDYLVPAFEDFSNYRDFRLEWVVETLTMLKVDGSKLYNSYVKLIEVADLPVERTNQLIYAALWLLAHGFAGDISLIEDKIKNVLENSENPYYNEIHELMT